MSPIFEINYRSRYADILGKELPRIPSYAYVVNGKPGLEWVMERQWVTADKASGITNDPNLWAPKQWATQVSTGTFPAGGHAGAGDDEGGERASGAEYLMNPLTVIRILCFE